MAIQSFSSLDNIFDVAATSPDTLISRKVYSETNNPQVGTLLYFDENLSNKVGTNSFYGLVYNGQIYAVRTDGSSRIAEMRLKTAIVQPDGNTVYPLQSLGVVEYGSNKEVSRVRSLLSFSESNGNLLLSDDNWATDFSTSQPGYVKVCYLSTEDATDAVNRTLQNLDVTDLEGFDLAPVVAYMHPSSHLLDKYAQHYIHLSSNGKNRRQFKQGDLEYFYMPASHNFEGGLLPSFYKDFPDFEVPAGKICTSQYLFEDDLDLDRVLKKGRTFSINGNSSKRHYYDYESWARDLGMPRAYEDSQATANAWANINEETAKNAFIEKVVNPNRNNGLTTLNFEVFSGVDKNDNKLYNVIKSFKDSNPSSLFSIWAGGQGPVNSHNHELNNASSSAAFTPDLQFTGNYNDWLSQRNGSTKFGGQYSLYNDLTDIAYTNDYYLSRYNSPHWLQQYLMTLIMNRKFYPNKKYLFMLSHLMETTVYQPADWLQVLHNGEVYKLDNKPAYPPGVLFTAGLFSTAYGDGSEQWNDPLYMHTDPSFFGGFARNHNNENLNNRFKNYPNSGRPGMYALSGTPIKGLDWFEAGKWAASMNKDCIESGTPWEFIDFSTDGGSNWFSGVSTLPSETFIDRNPVVLWKPHSNGNEGLLLFCHPYKNPLTQESFLIRLSSNNVKEITQIGDYASCVRITI